MSSKIKIILSISSVCLILLVAAVAIVAVFASRQQTFESGINVSYIAREVEGSVQANWYEGSGSANAMKTSSNATTITFTAGKNAVTDSLAPQKSIELSADTNFVVFEYIFTNTGKPFNATLKYTDDASPDTTLSIYAGYNATKLTASSLSAGNTQVKLLDKKSGEFITFQIADGATMYAYVVVSIPESALGSDASFSGSFTWNLETAVK